MTPTHCGEELDEALLVDDGPTVVRFPKGAVPEAIPAVKRLDGMVDVLKSSEGERGDVLLVAVGPFASLALEIAERLDKQGISVAVVDPRWVLPVADSLVKMADKYALVVTIEDGGLHGGIGSTVSAAMRAAGVPHVVPRHGRSPAVPRSRQPRSHPQGTRTHGSGPLP